jgi:hypothetical protein
VNPKPVAAVKPAEEQGPEPAQPGASAAPEPADYPKVGSLGSRAGKLVAYIRIAGGLLFVLSVVVDQIAGESFGSEFSGRSKWLLIIFASAVGLRWLSRATSKPRSRE